MLSKTTRDRDLEELDQKAQNGSLAAKKMRDRVYQQSKEPEIERLRKLLIEAHRQGDLARVAKIEAELMKWNRG